MSRHAYLIMAHNEWKVLNVLLSLVDDERNDVYLHIDKKVKVLPEFYQCKKAGFYLLKDRYDVRWGDFSQIATEMYLFESAHRNEEYTYYHLLSGVDLPIKSQREIHAFFDKHHGKEFVGFFNGDYHEADTMRKVSHLYLLMQWNKRCTYLPKWKIMVGQIVRHSFLSLQKMIHYHRCIDMDFRKGHNWVSLTDNAVNLLLEKKEYIMQRFSMMQCPDEIYKQSIIWNSALRKNIFDIHDDRKGSMRFIDWERGEPYMWQDEDESELLSSPYLFARKISSASTKLIKSIVERVQTTS